MTQMISIERGDWSNLHEKFKLVTSTPGNANIRLGRVILLTFYQQSFRMLMLAWKADARLKQNMTGWRGNLF